MPVLLSRTGYTGEDGYEIYLSADHAVEVWDLLLAAGGGRLTPAGLGARDTLRTEMPDLAVVDIPEGAAEGVPAYTTWAFGVGVAAPSSMDADTAYAIVSAVMADQTTQANAMAGLKDESLAQMTLDYGSIPLHPGAARWFEEQGIEIPAKLKAE